MQTLRRYLLVLCTLVPMWATAQKLIEPRPKASPLCMATFLAQDTYLKVTYGQPLKRGREIFGNLVPYGEVWRTGANEATEFTTTQDIRLNNQKVLKAGTYTLYTIPRADNWTLIFNTALGQWGAYKYDEIKTKNALEINVPVQTGDDTYEGFTVQFEANKKGVEMLLLWDKTKIALPISFTGSAKK